MRRFDIKTKRYSFSARDLCGTIYHDLFGRQRLFPARRGGGERLALVGECSNCPDQRGFTSKNRAIVAGGLGFSSQCIDSGSVGNGAAHFSRLP